MAVSKPGRFSYRELIFVNKLVCANQRKAINIETRTIGSPCINTELTPTICWHHGLRPSLLFLKPFAKIKDNTCVIA